MLELGTMIFARDFVNRRSGDLHFRATRVSPRRSSRRRNYSAEESDGLLKSSRVVQCRPGVRQVSVGRSQRKGQSPPEPDKPRFAQAIRLRTKT